MALFFSFLIVATAIGAMVRGVDVRVALGAAGLLLALVAGVPEKFVVALFNEAINLKTIGPICASLGYAYVLKATGCDREMVRVLLASAPARDVAGGVRSGVRDAAGAVAAEVRRRI